MVLGGFAPANRQSSHNADDSQPLCGGLPSGESTLQIIRLTALRLKMHYHTKCENFNIIFIIDIMILKL